MTIERPHGRSPIGNALTYLFISNIVVVFGMLAGTRLLRSPGPWGHTFDYHGEVYAHWDGQWYKSIAARGYSYNPATFSNVAFFPAYPLLGRLVAKATGLEPEVALLIVSNLALASCFVLFPYYFRLRATQSEGLAREYAVLCFGILPTTFFFRMAYSEPLFLFITLATFCAAERKYPLLVVAILVGLATAIRPVGIGLIPPLTWHTWRRTRHAWRFARTLIALLPVSVWGISAYSTYLYVEFGDPLAFVKTQTHWRDRGSPPWPRKVLDLATLEPIRSVFDPSSPGNWKQTEPGQSPLLSLHAVDPIVFLAAAALIVAGGLRRWLTPFELITATAFLAIPYWTVGYGSYMKSMARYSSSVIPVYIVLGRIASRLEPAAVAAAAALSGLLLGLYSAKFVAYYFMI